jgi:Barstar (barnase inhibitor)
MDIKIIRLPSDKITDWDTFHAVFQEVFGFPEFYGRNMDAWNDCMTYLDDPDSGMSSATVAKGGLVVIRVENASAFKKRCPVQYDALVECAAFVNYRRVDVGESPILALMLIGHY